ncbi:MAG: phage holin family protein [Alphaproteobacteria bacterium]|nr:phage holin family protein [Alphaproteobacteria bacterium]
MSGPSGTLAGILRGLVADASLLVRQEIRLLKAELSEKADRVQKGLISIASGMLLALAALIILLQAVVVALANIMPPSIAALVVGVVVAAIAFVLLRIGQQTLKPENLKPQRTLLTAREGDYPQTGVRQ